MQPGERLRQWVPRWWRGEAGVAGAAVSLALAPAEALLRGVVGVRGWGYEAGLLRAESAPIPVVSIGNIGVGGAGKTPFSAWVAARLRGWGRRPALVLRGYGTDEILVHRELNPEVPVFAAARRIEAVRRAAGEGCDVAVLDDAFQHRALFRDLDLVLVGADGWQGAVRMLPRGPWREGLGALRRADFVVVTSKAAATGTASHLLELVSSVVGPERVVLCRIEATGLRPLLGGGGGEGAESGLEALRGKRVLAVASLADPRPFVAHLELAGAEVELAAFPDHHEFTAAEARLLQERARGRVLVMTRKEAVKLRPLLEGVEDGLMLEQRIVIESGEEVLMDALRTAVNG